MILRNVVRLLFGTCLVMFTKNDRIHPMKNQKRYAVITAVFLSMVHLQGIAGPRSGRDWVGFVNPLIGTLSDFEFSNGNTYPAIALPRGMNFWTPQTGRNGDGWQYAYQAKKIVGFKQTHQPSPWINDYGCFSIMPARGACGFRETER